MTKQAPSARDSASPDVYVVLGATGGIGSLLCRRLAGRGAKLVVAGRDEERVSEVAREVSGDPAVLDATLTESVEACVKSARERHGRIHGIVNLVGSVLLKPAHVTTDREWSSTLETNLGSAFAAVRAAGKVMREGGSVVLMASAAATTGLANHEAIAAAKAGVVGLTLAAAATYAGRGLRFNAVAPGLVRTPLSRSITSSEVAAKASAAMHPLGRVGEPEDVVPVLDWLLGPESSWVTGQVIGVDGGLSSLRSRAR